MTRLQLRNLKLYLRFRERPPTVPGLLWANHRAYLIMALIFGWAVGVTWNILGSTGALVFGGIFAGTFLCDLRRFWSIVRFWPVTKQVLDWDKIQQLVDSECGGAS